MRNHHENWIHLHRDRLHLKMTWANEQKALKGATQGAVFKYLCTCAWSDPHSNLESVKTYLVPWDHRGFCQDDSQELFDGKLSWFRWKGRLFLRQSIYGKHHSWVMHLPRSPKQTRKQLRAQADAWSPVDLGKLKELQSNKCSFVANRCDWAKVWKNSSDGTNAGCRAGACCDCTGYAHIRIDERRGMLLPKA